MFAIDGKHVVQFRNTVAIGTGEPVSIAKVGDYFWAIFQTQTHQTAILIDSFGDGSVPCSTLNVVDAFAAGEKDIADCDVIHAMPLVEAVEKYGDELFFLADTLEKAWAKLDKRTGGYTPLMDVADENAYAEHRAYVENFIAGAFDNVLAA